MTVAEFIEQLRANLDPSEPMELLTALDILSQTDPRASDLFMGELKRIARRVRPSA